MYMVQAETRQEPESRLRREVGRFRERFQALSAIQHDLESSRSPEAVLQSVQAVIASTLGAESVWMLDARLPAPRPMIRGGEAFPDVALGEVQHCLRAERLLTVTLDEGKTLHLVPLHSGVSYWGVLAVRMLPQQNVDAEGMRFLSLVGSMIGGAASLWESRVARDEVGGLLPAGWLALPALPGRLFLVVGESGTGKHSLARRMHERYVGGTFTDVRLTGDESDESAVEAALRSPGLGSLYVHDAVRAAPAARHRLLAAVDAADQPVIFLGTADLLWLQYPDALLSRAATMTIRMPALRERPQEVPGIVQRGLTDRGVNARISAAARRLLSAHAWPGNYGELAKFVSEAEQALRLEAGTLLSGAMTRRLLGESQWVALDRLTERLEAHILGEALRRFDGNRTAAGRALGLTPRQVGYKCTKYGLD